MRTALNIGFRFVLGSFVAGFSTFMRPRKFIVDVVTRTGDCSRFQIHREAALTGPHFRAEPDDREGVAVLWKLTTILALAFAAGCIVTNSVGAQTTIPPNLTMAQPTARPLSVQPVRPGVALPPKPAAVSKASFGAAPFVKRTVLSCTPPPAPKEIVELARALDWNPDLIYEYVHNNIQTLPIYGSFKGSYGTLIDGAGAPVDQAELMYVLLQQSCYSPQYEIGTIFLSAVQLSNWLGISTNETDVEAVLEANGFPVGTGTDCSQYTPGSPILCIYPNPDETVFGADIPWVWVSVPIPNGGGAYQFEPASKTFQDWYGYSRVAQIANLGSSALQYAQGSFLNAAESGASGIGTPQVSGINRASVRQNLTTYANNLIAYVKANDPSATTNDIIGGATINRLPFYTPPTSGPTLWGQTILCNIIFLGTGTCSPNLSGMPTASLSNLNSLRTTLTLTLGYNTGTAFTQLATPQTLYSSSIYGHRLSVVFDATTNVPSLLLDGVTQVMATGAVPPSSQLTIRTAIDHPTLPCVSLPISEGATGNTSSGSPTISNLSGVACSLSPGMYVIGTGIPAGSVITQVNNSTQTITISNNATTTNTSVALSIVGPSVDNIRVTPAPGAVFVVGTAWGGSNRGMIEKHRLLLQQNAAQNPNNPNAEPVLGEGLAMIGYTWLAEFTRAQQRISEISGVTTTYFHAVGIIGMKGVAGSAQGPFVDLPQNVVSVVQRVGRPSLSIEPTSLESSAFAVAAGVLSILESGHRADPARCYGGIDRQVARSVEPIRPDILNQRSRDFRRQLQLLCGVDQANARDDICCGRSRADRLACRLHTGRRVQRDCQQNARRRSVERSDHGLVFHGIVDRGRVPATPLRR